MRRTKIICTIGPASKHLIEELKQAGMDVARINTAYTDEVDIGFRDVLIDVRHWSVLERLELPESATVALSFVRKRSCLENARRLADLPICAKIETMEAIQNLEDIVKGSDMVMIARGDLGKEFGIHMVPMLQQRIIEVCNRYDKPFIVATEVLKSMVNNAEPTRAEAVDVFNAVNAGAWGIMLAEETAIGNYPVEAARWLDVLIRAAETHKESGSLALSLPTRPSTGYSTG